MQAASKALHDGPVMEADTADYRAKGGRYNTHVLEVVPLKKRKGGGRQ